ncbi:helix-turn-helix domain-containing protein [Streptomyces mirabilis]|uniref:helix-turn-helix domain-containing protein n=1 Tax=Streptomyces mirabilis TaxID=68239 RepID=UPI0033A94BDD
MQSVPLSLPTDLVGPNRAAELLHVGRATVYRMIARGEITGYRLTSGLTKVSEAEVRSHVVTTRPGPMRLDAAIQRVVDAAPSLTSEQMDRLRSLLAPSA